MTGAAFDPRAAVAEMGTRALRVVETIAAGKAWTPATLSAASQVLECECAPRLAKRLHLLSAIWSVNHPEVHL